MFFFFLFYGWKLAMLRVELRENVFELSLQNLVVLQKAKKNLPGGIGSFFFSWAKIKQIKRSVSCYFNAVILRFILKFNVFFPSNLKNGVSHHHKSFLICTFHCKCDVCYIGHNTQILENRIKQHVPHAIK